MMTVPPRRNWGTSGLMLRAFVRDSFVYGLATVLVRAVSILLVPVLTRLLAPADYGAIDILAVFTGFVSVIVSLEIVQAVARFYPDSTSRDDRIGYASTSLWFAVIGYTGFLIVGEALAAPIARGLLGGVDRTDIVRVALVALWGNGVFYVAQSQLRWRLLARRYAVSSIVYSVVSMGTGVLFVLAGSGVVGVFGGQIVGASAGIALSLGALRTEYRFIIDRAKLRAMLAFSAPLIPSSLGVLVTLYIDRIAINTLLGLSELGLFGIGFRLASVITLLSLGVQSALTPLIYTHHRALQTPAAIARIFRFYVAGTIVVSLGLGLFARELLAFLTTPAYAGGAVVVPLLAPALCLSGMYIFAPGPAIAKRTGLIAGINLGGAALNTALNLLLIPAVGILGAAAATLVSSAAVFSANMMVSQRLYPVPHDWRALGLVVAAAAALVAAGWWLVPVGLVGLAVKGVFMVLGAALCVAAGLIERVEVAQVLEVVYLRLRRIRNPAG